MIYNQTSRRRTINDERSRILTTSSGNLSTTENDCNWLHRIALPGFMLHWVSFDCNRTIRWKGSGLLASNFSCRTDLNSILRMNDVQFLCILLLNIFYLLIPMNCLLFSRTFNLQKNKNRVILRRGDNERLTCICKQINSTPLTVKIKILFTWQERIITKEVCTGLHPQQKILINNNYVLINYVW